MNFYPKLCFFLFKPYIFGFILYIWVLVKANFRVSLLEFLLTISLIYQLGLLIELLFNSMYYYGGFTDYMTHMSTPSDSNAPNNNNNTNNNFNYIPQANSNTDYARIIRYLSLNIATLALRRPVLRIGALSFTNSINVFLDILSDERRSNFWIDTLNNFTRTGRFRGGQPGSGPFERESNSNNNTSTGETPGSGNKLEIYKGSSSSALNFRPKGDEPTTNDSSGISDHFFIGDFIRDFFSPIEHSIPLDTLINVHQVMHFGLFVLIFFLIVFTFYCLINFIILYNKDYLLNKVKNKYTLMYVKYIIFKSKVDLIILGFFIFSTLFFILYILHYLIVRPIVL